MKSRLFIMYILLWAILSCGGGGGEGGEAVVAPSPVITSDLLKEVGDKDYVGSFFSMKKGSMYSGTVWFKITNQASTSGYFSTFRVTSLYELVLNQDTGNYHESEIFTQCDTTEHSVYSSYIRVTSEQQQMLRMDLAFKDTTYLDNIVNASVAFNYQKSVIFGGNSSFIFIANVPILPVSDRCPLTVAKFGHWDMENYVMYKGYSYDYIIFDDTSHAILNGWGESAFTGNNSGSGDFEGNLINIPLESYTNSYLFKYTDSDRLFDGLFLLSENERDMVGFDINGPSNFYGRRR